MAKITNIGGFPFSGIVNSPVVGQVVDNDDPDELGRIKVKFPTLDGDPESFWLRLLRPDAGKEERGFYAVPEMEDEVLCLFVQGSQDQGIILGQVWNGIDKPPSEAIGGMPGSGATDTGGTFSTDTFTDGSSDDADNDRRLWKSRSGHLFVFDDTSGSESVQIWDKEHQLAFVFDSSNAAIYITNTKGDIHIRCKNDILIDAGNDIKMYAKNNIEVESKMETSFKTTSGDWKVDSGMNITTKSKMDTKMEATMNFEAKGTMNAKVEGSMNFEAKGGMMAKVEGGAMTQVKGGVVMIN